MDDAVICLDNCNNITRKSTDDELSEWATIRNFRIVRQGVLRRVQWEIKHYNLDMMIFAVGYRVRSNELMVDVKWLKL